MTYNQLRQAIQATASNNDPEFQEQINNFIVQAENLIYQSVRLPKFSTSAALSIPANAASVQAPTDFLSADSITLNGQGPLYKKDPEFLYEVYPSGQTGMPRFFAMSDDLTIIFGPTPDQAYTAKIRYFSKPASIIDQDAETYVSSHFPAALLNGALMFAYVFMQNPDMKEVHKEIFVNSLGLAGKFVKNDAAKQTFEKTNAAVSSGDQI